MNDIDTRKALKVSHVEGEDLGDSVKKACRGNKSSVET